MIMCMVFGMFAITATVSAQDSDNVLADLLAELGGADNAQNAVDGVVEDPIVVPEEDPTPEEPVAEGDNEHNAAEDILDALGGDYEYAGPEVIEVPLATITVDSAMIKTTQILYEGTPIDMYRVYYSTNTIADFLDVSDLKEVDLNIESTLANTVELKLEGLMEATTYYLIVAPVDPNDATADPLDLISDEVQFTTKATAPVVEDSVETDDFDGMYVNDISYTYIDNKVTVTWNAMSEVQTVWLSIKMADASTYAKLADVPATAGQYTFTVQEAWLHLLKVETKNLNGEVFGKEQIQSIKVDEVLEAEIWVAPPVGPATNMMIAIVLLAMLSGYVYQYRKVENN